MAGTWSKIDGFENYSVSDNGEVRNDKRDKLKAQRLNRYGYPITSIYKDGKAYTHRVHRLVADAFVDNPENKPQVNHKDGDKTNNNAENLEWVTGSENMKHAVRTGLFYPESASNSNFIGCMKGRKNPAVSEANSKPVRVVETGEEFKSIIACSKELGLSDRGICDVLNGRQKTHGGLHFERIEKDDKD